MVKAKKSFRSERLWGKVQRLQGQIIENEKGPTALTSLTNGEKKFHKFLRVASFHWTS